MSTATIAIEESIAEMQKLYVSTIVPSRWQPRTSFDPEALLELAKHIDDHGLMYPVIVFINEDGEHELVAGERRTRAVIALELARCDRWITEHGAGLREAVRHIAEHGWHMLADDLKQALIVQGAAIEARIEPGDDHHRLHQLAVADNIQRENLSPLEEARAIDGLMADNGYSQREVARQLGWSQSKVQERLSLLHMAAETRDALTARAIGPSHARYLAKLPEAVQPAMTRQIQQLIDREGDQAASTRQIAVMSSQLRKFLEPDRWLPAAEQLLAPLARNNLRLVRYLLQTTELEPHAEAIVGLRDVGDYDHTNVIGKDPARLNGWHVTAILKALTGDDQIERVWMVAATTQGWTCESCHLGDVAPPAANGWETICPRHREDAPPARTCRHYRGKDEPLAILFDRRDLLEWARQLEVGGIVEQPEPHLTDYETWRDLVVRATRLRDARQVAAEQERETRHIVQIAEYWQAQQRGGACDLRGQFPHFQGHYCHKCADYRHDLRARDLPPCRWVAEPLPNYWGNGQRAPTFAVLVRQDGLMLPRCEQFRLDIPLRITPSKGFALPDRTAVLEWVHRILVGGNRSTCNGSLQGPVVWLPYTRPVEKVHDLDGLLRYLKHLWDDVGDEAMATLITVICAEEIAMHGRSSVFDLVDPTTGKSEAWQGVQWEYFQKGDPGYGWDKSWPVSWVKRE